MRTTIDRAGRIVVPKPIRDRLQLLGGGEVEVVERDGVIEITPVPVDMVFADTAEGPVVVSVERTAEFVTAPSVMEGAEGAIRLQIRGDPRVAGGTLVIRYDAAALGQAGGLATPEWRPFHTRDVYEF